MQVEEYRILPEPYTEKTKSGIHHLLPKQMVKVSDRVKEGENWLNTQGESYSHAVYKGIRNV